MLNFFWSKQDATQKPKSLGGLGEEAAQKEYQRLGYRIIAKNEYNRKGLRLGEIDFVAQDNKTVVFVEVKTRVASVGRFGRAEEAVNTAKQRKILKAVKIYLQKNPELNSLRPQIDVCIVMLDVVDKSLKCAKIITNAVEDWN